MPRKTTDTSGAGVKLPPDVKVSRKTRPDGTIKVYYYRRSTGKPIEGEPGTLLFEKSWAAASGDKPEPKAVGEVVELIRRFQSSPEAKRATPDSVKQRDWYLGKIEARFGYMTLSDIQDDRACQDFYAWRDDMSEAPVQADRAVQTLGQLLRWAKQRKIIKVNQAEDVGKLIDYRQSLRRSRAKLVYTPEMEADIVKAVRPCLVTAFYLALYTGARELDLCSFRWDMIDDEGWLVYTPSKTRNTTGVEVHLPTFALPPLKALLERQKRLKHGFILSTDFDFRLTAINLKHMWPVDRDNFLGHSLHWHDIRGTTVTRLFNVGCTHAEVASITGHALSDKVAGMTTEMARSLGKYATINRAMALNAYQKWAAAEFTLKPVELEPDSNVVQIRRHAAKEA